MVDVLLVFSILAFIVLIMFIFHLIVALKVKKVRESSTIETESNLLRRYIEDVSCGRKSVVISSKYVVMSKDLYDICKSQDSGLRFRDFKHDERSKN